MEFSNNHQNFPFVPNNSQYQVPPSNSNPLTPQERKIVEWTWEENKIFENTLAEIGIGSQILLPTLAMRIPTKSISQFNHHLQVLAEDIRMIESDLIAIPNYGDYEEQEEKSDQVEVNTINDEALTIEEITPIKRQRKRGTPWTKREHELFIEGLEKYGKGKWKSIARQMVKTKTPTQVASHAQKYFLRLRNPSSRRKDGSIMRTVDDPAPSADQHAHIVSP